MTITVTDFVDVKERAHELNCNVPTDIAILPSNFATAKTVDELIYMNSTATVRKLLRQAGISESRIEKPGEKYPQLVQESVEWIGPLIFISQNAIIPIVLGVISNYLTHYLKGRGKNNTVKLHFIQDANNNCKHIYYEGGVEGIKELEATMLAVNTTTTNPTELMAQPNAASQQLSSPMQKTDDVTENTE